MRTRISTSITTAAAGVQIIIIDVIEALLREGFGKETSTDTTATLGTGWASTRLGTRDTVGASTVCEVDGLLFSVEGSEHRVETITLACDVC